METTFTLTHKKLKIPCVLTTPDDGPVRRAVLGVHGICGSKEDTIQHALAEEMEMFSCATLRFDFPLHGDHAAPEETFTLANCRSTLMAAARHLWERFPEAEHFCIFATGFGAYVTLFCLDELHERIHNLRLVVQTPSVLMHETLLKMARQDRESFRDKERIMMRHIPVHYRLYEELHRNIALVPFAQKMLILHNEENKFIQLEHIRQFRRINEDSKLVLLSGIQHEFKEAGAWDMVLDLTRDWFEFEQVFLCDWQ